MYVVVVDDSPHVGATLRHVLAAEGYVAAAWPREPGPVTTPSDRLPDLVLLDIHRGAAGEGVDTWTLLRNDALLQGVPIVVAAPDAAALTQYAPFLQSAGCLILPQPFRIAALLRVLQALNVTAPAGHEAVTYGGRQLLAGAAAAGARLRGRLPRGLARWLRLAPGPHTEL